LAAFPTVSGTEDQQVLPITIELGRPGADQAFVPAA
jgi:hypothetical protein